MVPLNNFGHKTRFVLHNIAMVLQWASQDFKPWEWKQICLYELLYVACRVVAYQGPCSPGLPSSLTGGWASSSPRPSTCWLHTRWWWTTPSWHHQANQTTRHQATCYRVFVLHHTCFEVLNMFSRPTFIIQASSVNFPGLVLFHHVNKS